MADKKTLHFIYNKYADKSISSFENLTELPMEISDGNSVATGESDQTGTDHSHKVSQSVITSLGLNSNLHCLRPLLRLVLIGIWFERSAWQVAPLFPIGARGRSS